MKKISITLLAGTMVFMLSACGQAKNEVESQADIMNDITQSGKETIETDAEGTQADTIAQNRNETVETDAEGMRADTITQNQKETDAAGKEDIVYDVLDSLVGEYSYTSDDSAGKLIIQKASDGYDISDYISESSYRFLANSSNIQTLENNKIYIEYPELLLSDDTVHFSYYTLVYGTDGIDVYYGMAEPENAEFLYHAVKKNDKDEDSVTAHAASEAGEKLIDFEAPGIKEYEYPSEFIMGDNLKTALAQLASGYISFDSGTTATGDWKQYFINNFIQNSRLTFDYLDLISGQNNGLISIDELNYIQYSLTNTEVDFSTYVSPDGPDIIRYEAASPFCSGSIIGYDYRDTDTGVLITADLEMRYDGAEDTQKYEITAELVRNPYSCFDGYSITALSRSLSEHAPN